MGCYNQSVTALNIPAFRKDMCVFKTKFKKHKMESGFGRNK